MSKSGQSLRAKKVEDKNAGVGINWTWKLALMAFEKLADIGDQLLIEWFVLKCTSFQPIRTGIAAAPSFKCHKNFVRKKISRALFEFNNIINISFRKLFETLGTFINMLVSAG